MGDTSVEKVMIDRSWPVAAQNLKFWFQNPDLAYSGLVNVKILKNRQLRDHLCRSSGTARPRVSPEMNELE